MQKFRPLVAVLVAAACLVAAQARAVEKDKAPGKAASAKDPVKEAFALPRGVVLRTDQQAKLGKLKQTYEPQLREVLDKAGKAADEIEKRKAAGEAKRVRQEISASLRDILTSLPPVVLDHGSGGARERAMRGKTRVRTKTKTTE